MNVYILTEKGKRVGLGHAVRCEALAQAFLVDGIEAKIIMNEEHHATGLHPIVLDWINQPEKAAEMTKDADIVVIDSYLAPLPAYEKIAKTAAIPVYFDDFNRLDYPSGVVVNSSIHAEKMKYPHKEKAFYMLGPAYVLLRSEFWKQETKTIPEKITNVFVSFGGGDARNLTPKVTQAVHARFPEYVLTVIIAKDFSNRKEIEWLKGEKVRLIIAPDARRIRGEMLSADVAITPNGQTLYELASVGVPTVVVAVTHEQEESVRQWCDCGFATYGGTYTDANLLKRISDGIESIREKEIREKKSKRGIALVDGKGALRVKDELLTMFDKGIHF